MSEQQDPGAKAEQELLTENRTTTLLRRKNMGTAVLPQGKRVPAPPLMQLSYDLDRDAGILGAPEAILSEDWKGEHQGWHYAWPVRQSDRTAALIRAGYYIPVPFEAVSDNSPLAAVAEVATPGGRYVVWMQHLLVAIPPEAWQKLVTQYEQLAISRTVTNADAIERAMNSRLSGMGYEAEVTPFSQVRESKTGD